MAGNDVNTHMGVENSAGGEGPDTARLTLEALNNSNVETKDKTLGSKTSLKRDGNRMDVQNNLIPSSGSFGDELHPNSSFGISDVNGGPKSESESDEEMGSARDMKSASVGDNKVGFEEDVGQTRPLKRKVPDQDKSSPSISKSQKSPQLELSSASDPGSHHNNSQPGSSTIADDSTSSCSSSLRRNERPPATYSNTETSPASNSGGSKVKGRKGPWRKNYDCRRCIKSYLVKGMLINHLMTVHNIGKEDLCEDDFEEVKRRTRR